MRLITLFLVIVLLVLSLPAQAPELISETLYPDGRLVKEFFFPLPAYKNWLSLYPQNIEEQIQRLLDNYPDIMYLEWTGTADLETRVFENLKKANLASRENELDSLFKYADERSSYAAKKWGGLTKPGKLVKDSKARGILLTLTIKLETKKAELLPVRVECLLDTLYTYPNLSFDLSRLAHVIWSDSSRTRDAYFRADPTIEITATGQLKTSSVTGLMHVLALYQLENHGWMDILPIKVLPLPKIPK